MGGRTLGCGALMVSISLIVLATSGWAAYVEEEFKDASPPATSTIVRPMPPLPPSGHVPELARYLDRLEIRRPLVYGRLAVYPVVLRGGGPLGGSWWTMDAAFAKGILLVMEKEGGGSVPVVVMENRSRTDHVFVMAGEVVSGGKQTRTMRQDVLLAPGQRIEVPVFCVEQHRWKGDVGFSASGVLVPQSIQKEMRKGAAQDAVWSEVARSNAALGADSATGSLEHGLKAAPVRRELDEVRRVIMPEVPGESVGFIFADRFGRRGLGAEFFGRADLARALLPKLIDAYAVDLVVPMKGDRDRGLMAEDAARDFLNRIRSAGSYRSETPGSGAGLRMRAGGLVGDGVSLGDGLVHFGCQVEDRIVPEPAPLPHPMPRPLPPGGGMRE